MHLNKDALNDKHSTPTRFGSGVQPSASFLE